MILVGVEELTGWQSKHPEARKELERWRKVMEKTDFQNGQELHATFRKTHDFVRPHCHVFDINGGNFRLIALVDFKSKTIAIDRIMNHKEYDRWECK